MSNLKKYKVRLKYNRKDLASHIVSITKDLNASDNIDAISQVIKDYKENPTISFLSVEILDISDLAPELINNLTGPYLSFYFWQYGHQGCDCFECLLYNLMHKADSSNRQALKKGFPIHFAIRQRWLDLNYCFDRDDLIVLLKKWRSEDESADFEKES